MTRQQKLAASEIKWQVSQCCVTSVHLQQRVKDALINSYIEVFRHTYKSFDSDKFRALCEGPFIPSVHERLSTNRNRTPLYCSKQEED